MRRSGSLRTLSRRALPCVAAAAIFALAPTGPAPAQVGKTKERPPTPAAKPGPTKPAPAKPTPAKPAPAAAAGASKGRAPVTMRRVSQSAASPFPITALATTTSGGSALAVAFGVQMSLQVYVPEENKFVGALVESWNGIIYGMAISSKDRLAIAGLSGGNPLLRIYDDKDKHVDFTGHTGAVTGVAWSPDGDRLATSSWDDTARVWDARSGEQIFRFVDHKGSVDAVAWSPDGGSIATGGADGVVRVWDARTGALRASMTGHAGDVRAVAFSHTGRLLASGGDDGTVRLWSATTGESKAIMRGHKDTVWAVAWHEFVDALASTGQDGIVRVWDETGREVARADAGTRLRALCWTDHGQKIAAGGSGGRVMVFAPE